jgi:hypothetical protein
LSPMSTNIDFCQPPNGSYIFRKADWFVSKAMQTSLDERPLLKTFWLRV